MMTVARGLLCPVAFAAVVGACGGGARTSTSGGEGGAGGDAGATATSVTSTVGAAATSTSTGGDAGSSASGTGGAGGEAPAPAHRSRLAVGILHACDAASGRVVCWGYNGDGRLGIGAPDDDLHGPTEIPLDGAVLHVSATGETCALLEDQSLRCWGPSAPPAPIDALASVVHIDSEFATFAVLEDGTAWSWGRGDHGQLGLGDTDGREAPTRIPGLEGIASIAAGEWFACAIHLDGDLSCWGANDFGQIGDGLEEDRASPLRVMSGVRSVALGSKHTCAVFEDAVVRCWGFNNFGQVGPGTPSYIALDPVEVPLGVGAIRVAAGTLSSCALLEDRTVACWGSNSNGQLGRGHFEDENVSAPEPVIGLDDVVELEANAQTVCARRADGDVLCWGANARGQLADGTTIDRAEPTLVLTAG